ncbi:MAG: hypothetical protein NZL96_03015 [Patescibacteria group bacterium]|nr:hypothetical protein [Patescibacteria group bacterium]
MKINRLFVIVLLIFFLMIFFLTGISLVEKNENENGKTNLVSTDKNQKFQP